MERERYHAFDLPATWSAPRPMSGRSALAALLAQGGAAPARLAGHSVTSGQSAAERPINPMAPPCVDKRREDARGGIPSDVRVVW